MITGKRKYHPGEHILYQGNTKYMIVYESKKLRDHGRWIVQYGACHLTCSGFPDRRYLMVPEPGEQIGRFKVFVIREDYILQSLRLKNMKK